MSRVRKFCGPFLWLIVLILAVGTTVATKRLYQAKFSGNGVIGSSVMTPKPGAFDFAVKANGVDNSVAEIWITDNEGHEIALCGVPGAAEAECTHDGNGNLDLEGRVTSGLLFMAGWSGRDFFSDLNQGRMEIQVYHSGGLLAGVYERIF